jgi:hypothetical protein
VAVVLFAHWGQRPAEAWITDQRILLLQGVLRPRVSTVDRKDVTRVELYVGDDTLVLRGSEGELYRAAILEAPDGLVEEIGLPVAVWRDTVESHLGNFTYLAFIFVLFSVAIVMGALFISVVVYGDKDAIRAALQDISPVIAPWYGVLAVGAIGAAAPLGTIVGLACAALLRRIMLTPDELASFRRAVRYPVWGGNDPQSPLHSRWMYRCYRAVRLALDRLLYGRPPDKGVIEPDIVAPGDVSG